MRTTLKKRLGNRSGFTLAEVMMAVLILVMVAGIVAAGVPAAINAYRNIVDAGNAEVLLSTAMTRFRDELGTATAIDADEATGTIAYTNSLGSRTVLTVESDGINMQEYADIVTGEQAAKYKHLFVSYEAASRSMAVTYTLNPGAYADGVLTISNLTVTKGDKTLATIPTLKIRVLAETD